MICVGIDPGLKGGIVAVVSGMVLHQEEMPTLNVGKGKRNNNLMDVNRVHRILSAIVPRESLWVAIEHQQSMPKQGISSTAKSMRAFGQLEGICVGMGLRYHIVRSQQWQKDRLTGVQGEGKQRAILYAQRMLPDLNLLPRPRMRKPHDGLADAACIALWLRGQVG